MKIETIRDIIGGNFLENRALLDEIIMRKFVFGMGESFFIALSFVDYYIWLICKYTLYKDTRARNGLGRVRFVFMSNFNRLKIPYIEPNLFIKWIRKL